MSNVLAHLAALALLAASCWLAGYAAERAWLGSRDLGALRPLARGALGVLLWMAYAFALAATGALAPGAVWAGIAASAGAAGLVRALRPGARHSARAADAAFPLALALVALPFVVRALAPDVAWDADVYHLALPKHWIATGGFAPAPFLVYAHWPLATELLYAVAMTLGDYPVAKLVHLAFGLAAVACAFAGCRAFHREASGWIAAPLVLANPVLCSELPIAYVDLAYAFFLSAAVLFATRALEEGEDARRCVVLAGLCGGALAGIKITGIAGAAAVAAVLVPRALAAARRGDATPARDLALRFALPVLALWAPWLAKSALETGNPVYPFLHGLLGGPDWSAALAARFAHWQHGIGMGRAPLDYLLLPLRVALWGGPDYGHFQGRIGAFWALLVPFAAIFGRRQRLVRSALGAGAVYFVLWAVTSQQMRFLIPLLPLLAMASAVAVVEALARIPGPRARRAALLLAPAAAAALALPAVAPAARGALELAPWLLADPQALRAAAVAPVYRFIADSLPPDARILLLNTNRGFFLERDYVADSFFEASQIADWLRGVHGAGDLRERLAQRGITHVLRERSSWGIAWPPALLAMLRDPSQATPVYRSSDGRFELFELR